MPAVLGFVDVDRLWDDLLFRLLFGPSGMQGTHPPAPGFLPFAARICLAPASVLEGPEPRGSA